MSSFSVEWDIVQEIVHKSLNPIKQWVWITFPQETLSYVSPLLYKGSLKSVRKAEQIVNSLAVGRNPR